MSADDEMQRDEAIYKEFVTEQDPGAVFDAALAVARQTSPSPTPNEGQTPTGKSTIQPMFTRPDGTP